MAGFVPEIMKLATTLPAVSFDMAGLTAWANGLCEKYKGLVVTEDMVAEIKAEMAELNKIKNNITNARIATVKELTEPIKAFEADVRKICTIFDTTYKALSDQVKAFAEREREEKRAVVMGILEEVLASQNVEPFEIPIQERWLNKSTSLKAIRDALDEIVRQHLERKALQEQADQALQERNAVIEQAVAGHNKKYNLDLPVSLFLKPYYQDLKTPLNEVLAGIYADFVRVMETREKVEKTMGDAGDKAEAPAPETPPASEPVAEVQPEAEKAPAPTPPVESGPPKKLTIILEYDQTCEAEVRATISTLKSLCLSFAARRC